MSARLTAPCQLHTGPGGRAGGGAGQDRAPALRAVVQREGCPSPSVSREHSLLRSRRKTPSLLGLPQRPLCTARVYFPQGNTRATVEICEGRRLSSGAFPPVPGFIRWLSHFHNVKYCTFSVTCPAVSETRCAILGRSPRRAWCSWCGSVATGLSPAAAWLRSHFSSKHWRVFSSVCVEQEPRG